MTPSIVLPPKILGMGRHREGGDHRIASRLARNNYRFGGVLGSRGLWCNRQRVRGRTFEGGASM